MSNTELLGRQQSFIESEGKSCSLAPELITTEWVYMMWGGNSGYQRYYR